MELIKFENVGIFFKRKKKAPFWALRDINLELYEGETLGVIGSNGAGKSTLLRVIAGIYHADKGVISRKTDNCALLTLKLGFVPYLNGIDNVILSGMLQGLDKKYVMERLPAILEFSELGETIYEPINTWSTGMVARLGFALALEIKPKILLIDETLSVGDETFKKKSSKAIDARIRSNQTVVLVSHSIATLKSLCDRVVWIENGTTMAQGAPDEIIKKYKKYSQEKVGTQNDG
jgi:lipopolysaccharide transport system ATP-binding protein